MRHAHRREPQPQKHRRRQQRQQRRLRTRGRQRPRRRAVPEVRHAEDRPVLRGVRLQVRRRSAALGPGLAAVIQPLVLVPAPGPAVVATVVPAAPFDPASALASGSARILRAARSFGVARILRAARSFGVARILRAARSFGVARILRAARIFGVTRILRAAQASCPARASRARPFHLAWPLHSARAFRLRPVFGHVRAVVPGGLPGAVRALRSVCPAPRIRALGSARTLGPDHPAGLTHASGGPTRVRPARVRPARVRSGRLDRRGVLGPRLPRERPGLQRS
jgi:hypothetical protein